MAVGLHHVRGPTLAQLRHRIAQASGAVFRARLAQNLAEEARHQVDDCFRGERDPYGKPWDPLKHRKGKILQDSGRMHASTATAARPDGFVIEITATYAKYHQYGAKLKPRANAHNRRGRFMSRARASTARGRAVRVSFSRGGEIPQRQMIPMIQTGGLGPIWAGAFNRVTTRMLDEALRSA